MMDLPIQGFISSFRLLDVVDILLVAFFLYKLLILIRNTRAVALIKGLIFLGVITILSSSRFFEPACHQLVAPTGHDGHHGRVACRISARASSGA